MGIVTFSPIQEGTGDPSPTNVRPIKPGLVLKSKNLLNPDKIYDGFIWGDDTIGNDAQWHYTDYVEVTEETTYTVSGSIVTNTSPTAQFVFYNESKSKISSIHSGQSNFTFTTPSGTRYVRLSLKGDDPFQLELGSIATEYEPYYNMEIYGGHVDFNTGELVEEYQLIQFDGTEAIYKTASGDLRRYTLYLEDKTGIQLYGSRSLAKCSHCILVNGSTAGTYGTLRYTHSESRGYRATYIALNDAYDEQFGGSVDNVLEWFKTQADNGAPFQLLVGRVDSITHSLTTSQLTQAYNQLVPVSPVMLNKRRRMLLDSPHLETVSGSIATFNTDMSTNIIDMKIHFYPVQEGSGDPSPNNIRPITGWDGVTITRCGKNLFGGDTLVNAFTSKGINPDIVNKTLTYTGSQANSVGRLFENFDEGQYTIIVRYASNSSSKNVNLRLYYTDGGSMIISDNDPSCVEISSDGYRKFLTPLDRTCSHLDAEWVSGTATLFYEDFGVFKGDVPLSDFVQYTSFEIPISFPQTIYGGYVDLAKGEVVQEYIAVHAKNFNWSNYSSNKIFYFPGNVRAIEALDISDKLQSHYGYGWDQAPDNSIISGISPNLFIKHEGVTSATEFIAWLEEIDPIIVYKLITSNIYTITPQALKSLKGINNIWSDANGSVEVKFWKH